MDRRVTPPKRVTSPTWGPLACVQTARLPHKKIGGGGGNVWTQARVPTST